MNSKQAKDMMKNKIIMLLTLFIMCITFNLNVEAADSYYRFTHNDHDVLVLGEVESVDDTLINVNVKETIVSPDNFEGKEPIKQLELNEGSKVAIKKDSIYLDVTFSTGDFILASLNKDGDYFNNANGIYKVTSLDKKTLEVAEPTNHIIGNKIIEKFVNTEGKITNMFFDDDRAYYRDENGNEIDIYVLENNEETKGDIQNIDTKIESVDQFEETLNQVVSENVSAKYASTSEIYITVILIILIFISIIIVKSLVCNKNKKGNKN